MFAQGTSNVAFVVVSCLEKFRLNILFFWEMLPPLNLPPSFAFNFHPLHLPQGNIREIEGREGKKEIVCGSFRLAIQPVFFPLRKNSVGNRGLDEIICPYHEEILALNSGNLMTPWIRWTYFKDSTKFASTLFFKKVYCIIATKMPSHFGHISTTLFPTATLFFLFSFFREREVLSPSFSFVIHGVARPTNERHTRIPLFAIYQIHF